MKFKLDENFGKKLHELFINSGHDVTSVRSQNLGGSSDEEIYKICCSEKRCLVTLDKDFSDIIRFPPINSAGIIVVRLPINPSFPLLEQLIISALEELKKNSILKQLWIVEPGRIRIRETDEDD